ncbi:MAG: hypothetical protein QOF41_326 [Methylobacteriaceae bacterium]|nr:hypothetical protein [Methylobacteriaceae bacterium]
MTDTIDVSDCDPVLAKAIQGLSLQEATDRVARDPTLYGFSRMRTFDPQRKPEIAATIRKLMNNFGAAKYCDNPLCRRAGTCMTPKVRCFWEVFDLMQRLVFPAMARKLKEMQARGEYEPEER